jgi:hypothetical protein
LERYDYLKDGLVSAMPFDLTLNRFLEAARYFENELIRFQNEKQATPPSDMSAFTGKK